MDTRLDLLCHGRERQPGREAFRIQHDVAVTDIACWGTRHGILDTSRLRDHTVER